MLSDLSAIMPVIPSRVHAIAVEHFRRVHAIREIPYYDIQRALLEAEIAGAGDEAEFFGIDPSHILAAIVFLRLTQRAAWGSDATRLDSGDIEYTDIFE